jgi:hypothetical protein
MFLRDTVPPKDYLKGIDRMTWLRMVASIMNALPSLLIKSMIASSYPYPLVSKFDKPSGNSQTRLAGLSVLSFPSIGNG